MYSTPPPLINIPSGLEIVRLESITQELPRLAECRSRNANDSGIALNNPTNRYFDICQNNLYSNCDDLKT